jgi:lipoprotein signal peptidase
MNKNLQFTPSLNEQAAGSTSIPQSLILITSTIIIVLLIRWLISPRQPVRPLWVLSVIIAGGLSNLIDRIFYGATIDFLNIYTIQTNLADIYIAFGGLVVLIAIIHQSLPPHLFVDKEVE